MSGMERIGQFDPGYYQAYGLARDPFAAQNESGPFYRGAHRSQRLNLLQHLIPHTDAMLLVIGERGGGKTTLLKRLTAGAADDWAVCGITGNAMLGADQLAVELAQCIGLAASGMTHQELLNSLRQRMSSRPGGGAITVLLVDDAHELPPGALQTLSALAAKETGPRVVLFADPQIETMLASAQLGSVQANIAQRLDLPALNPGETREYLELKLNAAGLHGPFPFNANQLKRIHRAGGGIPARIDELARRELAERQPDEAEEFVETRMPLAERLRSMALLLGIIAAALVLTVILARDAIQQLVSGNGSEQETLQLTDKTVDAKPSASGPQTSAPLPLPQASSDRPAPPSDKPSPPATDAPPADTATRITVLPPPRKPALIAPRRATPETTPDQPPAPPTKVPAKPAGKAPAPKPPLATRTQPREVKPTAKGPTQAKKPLSASQKWLALQNPDHYALQLMGSHSESAINQFLRRHKLRDKTVYLRSYHRGKYWYIVLYGDYTNREQAKAAIAGLPSSLRATRPWARRIGDIEAAPR